MTTKTYRGSCHCGRVKFEADIDLSQETTKCNCTFCWKRRWWSAAVKPEAFRSLQGEDELQEVRSSEGPRHGGFCRHCGITPYVWVDAAEWNDGEYVSINVAALDDVDPAELVAAPVKYCDGKADNWWQPPAETRHL